MNFQGAALRMERSTLNGNVATTAAGGVGGVRTIDAALEIVSSTISGNAGSGVGFVALVFPDSQLAISMATIAYNSVGVNILGGSDVFATHTIVANNEQKDCVTPEVSGDFNLDSDGSCLWSGSNNLVGVDPLLALLNNYGGSTASHRPRSTSPARDSGLPGPCPASTDQRGVARPVGTACDRGSHERTTPACGLGFELLLALIGISVRRSRHARATRESSSVGEAWRPPRLPDVDRDHLHPEGPAQGQRTSERKRPRWRARPA